MQEFKSLSALNLENNMWFTEYHKGNVGMTYRIKDILQDRKSEYQRITVVDTYEFGRMLILYGSVMLTEKHQFIYSEMISHMPINGLKKRPKKVLIIGGGDGGTLTEVLKYEEIEEVTVVEIDAEVISTCRTFFPELTTGFYNNTRVTTITGMDASKFVKNTDDETYDVVIADISDPVGPAVPLFQEKFYNNVLRILKDPGVFVTQAESPLYNQDVLLSSYKTLCRITEETAMVPSVYFAPIPIYPSGIWSFIEVLKGSEDDFHIKRFSTPSLPFNTKYYNPGIHDAAYAIPNYLAFKL